MVFLGGKFPYVFVFNEAIHLGIHRSFFGVVEVPLCIRFQLGNSFGNTSVVFFSGGKSSLMYSFSIRQFIWEYIGSFFLGWESSLMYSFSIRQFIWEY